MRTEVGLKVAVWVVFAVLGAPAAPASAEDAATADRFVRPSVEELAIPQSQDKGDHTGDNDTREAMCLMIEFGGQGARPAA